MPDSAWLPAIADALGVSIDRLFGRAQASIDDVAYTIRHYLGALPPEEAFRDIFAILTDEDVLRTVRILYTSQRISFDESYAAKTFQLTNPQEVLEKISRLRLLSSEVCCINGQDCRIWHFTARCGLLALFAVMNEYFCYNRSFDYQQGIRSAPYLRIK